jgi:hypothetical protein
MSEREASEQDQWPSAVTPDSGVRPKPGDIIIDPSLAMAPEPLVGDDLANALEEDESETQIPEGPLLAMKDRRHTQWHLLASHERHERLRETFAQGGDALYVVDDGRTHAMIGRVVGSSPSCTYSLIGRVTRADLDELRRGKVPITEAFDTASELAIVALAEVESVASSNVFDVALFDSPGEIPQEYLPGSPQIALTSDLEITAY